MIEATGVSFSPPHSLSALLLAGDEGCAHAAPAVLAESARLLARCVASPAQLELEAVAQLAPVDMATASQRWSAATQPLRRALARSTGEPAPEAALKVENVMSPDVAVCSIDDNLDVAARLMGEGDCGAVPVVDGAGRVVGIVTDRDACIAAYTQALPLHEIPVTTAMADTVDTLRADDLLADAERLMGEKRLRHAAVVDSEGHVVGMLALADRIRDVPRPERGASGRSDACGDATAGPARSMLCLATTDSVTAPARGDVATGLRGDGAGHIREGA